MVYSGHPEVAAVRLARHAAQVEAGIDGFDPDAVADHSWGCEPIPDAAAIRADLARQRADRARDSVRATTRYESFAEIHARLMAEEPAAPDNRTPAPASDPPDKTASGRASPG